MGEFSRIMKDCKTQFGIKEIRNKLLERSKEELIDMLIEYDNEIGEKQLEMVLCEAKRTKADSDWLFSALIFIFGGALYAIVLLEHGLEKWFEYIIAFPGAFLVSGAISLAVYYAIERFKPNEYDLNKKSKKDDYWATIKLTLFGAGIATIGWLILFRL